MTISSTNRVAGPYTGTGIQVIFPFSFKVFIATDLLVKVTNTFTGNVVNLVYLTDYTIVLNANQNANPGGSVTLVVPPTSTYTVTITSQVSNTQPSDLTNAGNFYPQTVNDSFDRSTIQIQQLQVAVNAALRLPPTSPIGASGQLPFPLANTLIGWDSSGTTLINYTPSVGIPTNIVFTIDTFANIALTPGVIGRTFELIQHTHTGIGGGLFEWVSSSGLTPDGGTISATSTAGVYAKRIAYLFTQVEFFGAKGDGIFDEWAAFDKCRAAGFVGYLGEGKFYYMSTGHNIGANLGFVSGRVKATVLMSRAGFSDATYSTLTQARCCFVFTSVNNPICKNIIFQFEAGAGIRTAVGVAVRGCTNPDMENLEFFGFNESRGGILTVDSTIGGRIEGVYVHDCTANSTTLPSMQLTGIEVDNNRISNLYSKDIYFGVCRFKNIVLGAAALAVYGHQCDGMTISAGTSVVADSGIYVEGIFFENVDEPYDCQTHNNYLGFLIGKTCVFGAKFVHAAKYNLIDYVYINGTASHAVVFAGSNTAAENCSDNYVARVVAYNVGNGGGALQKAAVGFDGATATLKPTNNGVGSLHCDAVTAMNYACYAEAGTDNYVNNITVNGTPAIELASIIAPATAVFNFINRTSKSSGYVTGRIYGGSLLNTASTTALTLTANTLYVVPWFVKSTARFTEILFNVSTLAAGSARVGIYKWSPLGAPTSLVYDAGTVSVNSTGTKTVALSTPQWLGEGWYGLAIVSDVAPQIYSTTANVQCMEAAGITILGTADTQMSKAFAYAALPATFGAVTYANANLPNLTMRVT